MSVTTRSGERFRMPLAPDADALVQARRFLHHCAERSGLGEDRADDLVQAAAELMALGGRVHQAIAVAVHEDGGRLTVLVDLAGLEQVDVRDDAAVLLNALSGEWGWRRLPGFTQVWCEIAGEPPR
ncbi:hypothetical protein NUM3379_22590 [Kineococcus sp. NUM-3379]